MNLRLNRRTLLRLSPITLASFSLATCSHSLSRNRRSDRASTASERAELPLTPACSDDPTPPQPAGPFYTPNSPQRQSLLEPPQPGIPLFITGQVISSRCVPLQGALVDVWHTNAQGTYDNTGYTFRGHKFTDAEGRYWLETIVPGLYPGRTRHIHVAIKAPQRPVLTTQLYFPDEPANPGDFLFDSRLLMEVGDSREGKQAAFNFVLATADAA